MSTLSKETLEKYSNLRQLTQEETTVLFNTKWWKETSKEKVAGFQFFQKFLCCPWACFRESIESLLGRPVFMNEFASPENLKEELLNLKGPHSVEEEG